MTRYLHSLGFGVQQEDYLLDNFYRENNDDVQAQSYLLEFLISSSR